MTGRDTTLQTLRLRYNAALAAHQGCTRALTEAGMAGIGPSRDLIEREAQARQTLDTARERLLAAMTAAITGEPAAGTAPAEAPGAAPRRAERTEGSS